MNGDTTSFLVSLEPFLFIAAIVAVIVFFVVRNHRHREKLRAFAAANGWTYTERDNSLTRRWRGQPFRSDGSNTASDAFRGYFGPQQFPFVAFTYSYTPQNSKGNSTSTTHHYEVCVLRIGWALPYLHVGREGLLTRVLRFLGEQDIDFESDDFNRAFLVQSTDPRFAYGVIHPQLMEWLLGPGRILAPWRIDGADLITYGVGRLDIQSFPNKLQAMTALVNQIPQHVWDDYA